MVKVEKFEFVEIYVPNGATATRWSFPDLPKLRYAALLGLETYTANNITVCPSGRPILGIAQLQKAFLTLYADERQDIYRIPFLQMNRTQASTDPFVRAQMQFKGQKITWDKCFIEFGSAPTVAADSSLAFGIYYA
jgi:hypothetical protein